MTAVRLGKKLGQITSPACCFKFCWKDNNSDCWFPFALYLFERDSKILPYIGKCHHSPNIFAFKNILLHSLPWAESCQTWGGVQRCEGGQSAAVFGRIWRVVKERRGSCAYANSPGNVSLRARGGWTACHRCRSWRSARPSGWSGASWACAGAWRCSYSGGTWAYWGPGERTRLERDRERHKVRFSNI